MTATPGSASFGPPVIATRGADDPGAALIVLLHRWLDKYSKAMPNSIAPPSYDHEQTGPETG
jgi:hypothetical protein